MYKTADLKNIAHQEQTNTSFPITMADNNVFYDGYHRGATGDLTGNRHALLSASHPTSKRKDNDVRNHIKTNDFV